MQSTAVVSHNRLGLFIGGTLLTQAIVLLVAWVVKVNYAPPAPTFASADFDIAPIAEVEAAPSIAEEPAPAETEPNFVIHKVRRGDTLTKIWTDNGGTYAGGLGAAKAFKEAGVPLTALRQGEELKITHSAEGDIIKFEKDLGDRTLVLEGSSASGYKHSTTSQQVVEVERTVSGVISNSFSASAASARVPFEVVDELVDLFSARVEFRRELHRGDTYTIIYNERMTASGETLTPGAIMAASLNTGGKLLGAVRHVGSDGRARYFDETGSPLGNYFLRYPLQFTRIASAFSKSRFHPVLKKHRPHNGVDFAAPTGTPVRSVADGVVIQAGYSGGAGNMIKVQHSGRYSTAYLHLSRINVKKGTRISRGDVIGAVGKTGLATGPHLHFSLYDRGIYVDPLKVSLPQMPTDIEPIPAGYLQAKLTTLKHYHEIMTIAAVVDGQNPRV